MDANTNMLDGKAVAREIEKQLRERVLRINELTGRTPTLATILVGDDPASATYVKMKGSACLRVGMASERIFLPADSATKDVIMEIEHLNQDPTIDGILLQHPVPGQIDERACFDAILPRKDVDGVTTLGFGKMGLGLPTYGSATPAGIMRLLEAYSLPVEGLHAVVVGRSSILGLPLAMMLLKANATVTICHSKTECLADHILQADIVVGALGRPKYIKSDWIADDAIIIDAGYHPDGAGDIEMIEELKDRCGAYTPVPGGVGPMTIAMLLENTVQAAEKSIKI